MNIALEISEEYYGAVKGMLNVLLPELEVGRKSEKEAPDLEVKVLLETKAGIEVRTSLIGKSGFEFKLEDKGILANCYTEEDFRRRCRALAKLGVYRLLCSYLDKPLSPWGTLVGVRPTKLCHFFLDKSLSYERVDDIFDQVYGVAKEKRELMLKVIKKERNFLPNLEEVKRKISIYIGIPFCPTRCDYCSFAAYPFSKYQDQLPNFLKALWYEIEELGKAVRKLGLEVSTLYLGGGTPTVLSADHLAEILNMFENHFPLASLEEFTAEAGRPDTITRAKLEVLQQMGVDRISINPQTMNSKTLARIGREHTPKQVIEAVKLAREVGFENINMDLIVGLPGEEQENIQKTAKEIKNLAPESLTLHTLVIKRAANLKKDDFDLPPKEKVKEHLRYFKGLANSLNLEPYYMYRQKGMLSNLENVGYAKIGFESIYNILMMEERQTVLGLGGGAVSKFVDPKDWSLEREFNPKFPPQYINEIKSRTESRVAKLTSLTR